MKKIITLLFCTCALQCALKAQFAKGADVSWLTQMEDSGRVFYNKAGVQQDLFTILKNLGINSVRFRVWVNPSNKYNGINDVVAKSIRAKNAGMRLMLDFHLSDTWADPGHQTIPAAWTNYSADSLQIAVYNHIYHVLDSLKQNNITPDWIQVGNETNNGMLWPVGEVPNWQNYANFITSGYQAAKAINTNIKVIVHISNGWNNSLFRWEFDSLTVHKPSFDVIGMSYYPADSNWSSTNKNVLANMNDMISRYGKQVMVCETGMPVSDPTDCRNMLIDLLNKVDSVTNRNGLGVFYWEPEGYDMGYSLDAWQNNGVPTIAMDAFSMTKIPTVNNLLKNANLQDSSAYWVYSGTPDMFKISTWSPDLSVLNSFANNYWEWPTTSVNGTITQTVSNLSDGNYLFSCQIIGATPGPKSFAALIAKDGNGILTTDTIIMPSSWTTLSMPVKVTSGQCTVGFIIKDTVNSIFWFDASNFIFQSDTSTSSVTSVPTLISNNNTVLSAYPNPFTKETATISYQLPTSQHQVTLQIYTVDGVLVESYTQEHVEANITHTCKLNADHCNPGIYIVKLKTMNKIYSLKLIKY